METEQQYVHLILVKQISVVEGIITILYSLEKQQSRILWNLSKAGFLYKYMKLCYVLLLRYLQTDC